MDKEKASMIARKYFDFIKKRDPNVKKAYMFGSYVKGTETEDSDINSISIKIKKLISLRIILLSVRRFKDNKLSLSASEISNILRIPIKIVRFLLGNLVECNILSEVIKEEGQKGFQPAKDVETLLDVAHQVSAKTICALGEFSKQAVITAIDRFPEDFEKKIGEKLPSIKLKVH